MDAQNASAAAQVVATCIALGGDLSDHSITKGRALYLSCEDDGDELHRRQENINRALEIKMRQPPDLLFEDRTGMASELAAMLEG